MLLDLRIFLILPVWLQSWILKWPFLRSHPNHHLFFNANSFCEINPEDFSLYQFSSAPMFTHYGQYYTIKTSSCFLNFYMYLTAVIQILNSEERSLFLNPSNHSGSLCSFPRIPSLHIMNSLKVEQKPPQSGLLHGK